MTLDCEKAKVIINQQPILYTLYVNATNMPFITIDEETAQSQVHIFTSPEEPGSYVYKYFSNLESFKGKAVRQEEMSIFYTDIYLMGVKDIVLHDEGASCTLNISDVTQFNDFSKYPENERPVMNRQLNESIIALIQEVVLNKEKDKAERIGELNRRVSKKLAEASFVIPAKVITAEDGEKRIVLPTVVNEIGEQYQPIFTDNVQYTLFVKHDEPDASISFRKVSLKELSELKAEGAAGCIINPGTYHFILTDEMIKSIVNYYCD